LLYPVTRAVYSCTLREPYPSDFALSGALGSQFLAQDIWSQEQGRRGTELWLTLSAVARRFKLLQAFLGTKARLENPRSDLVNAMRETAGILFSSLDSFSSIWKESQPRLDVPCSGCQPAVSLEPLRLNRKRLHQMFVFGVSELEPVFLSILSPSTLAELKRLATLPEDKFTYQADLWARTVYEFSAAYHKAVIGRDHIVQALVPLFRGRAYTFLTENREALAEQVEANIESLCQTFERERPYLLQLWDGGK
jgi:hypothetical protein